MNYYVTGTLIILLVAFALIVGPYPYWAFVTIGFSMLNTVE